MHRIKPKTVSVLILAVLIYLVTLPLYAKTYWIHVFALSFMWAMMGHSWNLLGGYTGQPSFGHAAFMGTGAYTAGVLSVHWGWPVWLGLLTAIPTAMLAGVIVGWVCFRLRGPYFALATLAMAEMFRIITLNWKDFTLGPMGILLVPELNKVGIYYIGLAILVSMTVLVYFVVHTKLGYCFQAIREDQDAAESMGINPMKLKMISTALSTGMAGVAGAYYLNLMGYVDPVVIFSLPAISIMTILVAILGGPGTISGPLVGAFIMVIINEYLRRYIGAAAAMFIFGSVLVVSIIILPNGIVGEYPRLKAFLLRLKAKWALRGGCSP